MATDLRPTGPASPTGSEYEKKLELEHVASPEEPFAGTSSQVPNSKLRSGDEALEILGDKGPIEILASDNDRVLRKIDLWLLPIMLGVYFLQQLDKSTLSYSSVFGLVDKAHLVGNQYSLLASIVYIAQLIWQPVSSFFLVKLPVGRYLAVNVFLWGAVLSCMTAATNFQGLIAARFFLGLCEATVAPTFVTITQMWWRRREQTVRTSYWYAMNGLTTCLGSLLCFGLGHIKSSLESYQIIFLFTGLLTVGYSVAVFIVLPDSPTKARFLNHDEKVIALERLRANQMGTENKEWKWEQFREALLDFKTYYWFAQAFLISIVSGGITTFGPLIVKGFGYDQFRTILFQIPFGAVQIVTTLGAAFIAQRIKLKSPVMACLTLPPIAGCIMLLKLGRGTNDRSALLGAYYIISFYPAITPLIYNWSSSNTAGMTKKTVTTGFLFVGQSAGNIVGPLLYTTAEGPYYHRGLTANLVILCVFAFLNIVGALYLAHLNRLHAHQRKIAGKASKVVDLSMLDRKEHEAAMKLNEETRRAENVKEGLGGEKAFADLTDLRNEDFIYVY